MKKSKNRTFIRSVPRHVSRKRAYQSNMTKSIINTDNDISGHEGVVLAMSRRNKLKNFMSTKGTHKFRMPNQQLNSRRSNSVSTHRNRSRVSNRRSCSSREKGLRKYYKSNSNLRRHKYIKNVLPIVAAEESRGDVSRLTAF